METTVIRCRNPYPATRRRIPKDVEVEGTNQNWGCASNCNSSYANPMDVVKSKVISIYNPSIYNPAAPGNNAVRFCNPTADMKLDFLWTHPKIGNLS